LTLVGGISYFTPEHGLICDNVLEFEVVLADGSVVTASQTSNSDLFTVLKGGGNNFGIVTALKFRTFPYKGMWGGLVTYLSTTIDAQFKALVNFADSMDKHVKGAVIVMPAYLSAVGIDLVANAYDYADPVAKPPAYDEFMAIPGNISDTTGLKNMSTLAKELEQPNTYR
jgi:FAD/FMN-containing dehydrogenase